MEPHNSGMSSHKDQIVLNKRQVSMIMASMVIFFLFVFIVGFFLGKRTVVEEFSSNVTENALHDQIDYLLTTQSLKSSQEDTLSDESVEDLPIVLESEKINSAHQLAPIVLSERIILPINNSVAREIVIHNPAIQVTEEKNIEVKVDARAKDPQYACLIGFGTKQAANTFVARLKKHHVPVILKTVISKSASGKTRTWYQAITPTYDSAAELQEIVNKVKRLEHIRDNDIKIVHTK